MATRNKRLSVLLDPPIFSAVETLAKEDGVSMSRKIRDIVKTSLGFDDNDYYPHPERIVQKITSPKSQRGAA